MSPKYVFLFIILFLIHGNATASQTNNQKGYEIDHPGPTDMVYFGEVPREPPLSPMQKVRVNNKFFYVYPDVVVPSIQSVFLLENTTIKKGEEVLDIGTGCGIQAIFAAQYAKRVVATDLSSDAVNNTIFNAKGHGLEHIIEARQGDLFEPIKENEKFDVIIFSIDYPHDAKSQGLWKVHERFFRQVKNYLKPGGRIYYETGLLANFPRIYSMISTHGLRIMKLNMYSALKYNREPMTLMIIPDPLDVDVPL
ncbi:MAG TPA: methyltransferase domain-containing protein [Gammaproteobacteria bacterium]|nr:methyltransferase domain-containing protein [Gammaproteobacteria bacterium]